MYKAKISIGGYSIGQIVPDEKAEIWAKMYGESPVEYIPDAPKPEPDKLDLNKDGKVDMEDAKIASKVLNQVKKGRK